MQLTETISWIATADRLPDADLKVLVFDGELVELGWYEDEGQWRYCESGGLAEGVTHWAEMPEGPTLFDLDEPEPMREAA